MVEFLYGSKRTIVVSLAVFLIALIIYKIDAKKPVASTEPPPVPRIQPKFEETLPLEIEKEPEAPNAPQISNPIPTFKNYEGIIQQAKEWELEAPDLVDIGFYGKSSRGTNILYFRITNEFKKDKKPVVLLTASLHGNEPLSTGTLMAWAGTILSKYGTDEKITKLLDEREIYFSPVVSPDSYPSSRYVDGVDPNRNFPSPYINVRSVPPVQAVQDLFKKIQPDAVISGHTFGRMFLYPHGDLMTPCEHDKEFQEIMSEMGEVCRYRIMRACQIYNQRIMGSEVDWYYRNGAFACVMEMGTHQQIPSIGDIKEEFQRTFKGILIFIEKGPLVEI